MYASNIERREEECEEEDGERKKEDNYDCEIVCSFSIQRTRSMSHSRADREIIPAPRTNVIDHGLVATLVIATSPNIHH